MVANDADLPDDLESEETLPDSPFLPENTHIVVQGEWMSSIARVHGFTNWQTIWNHEKNSPLRNKRCSPNILRPNDILYIPDIEIGEVSKSTEKRHRFKLKGLRDRLRLVLEDEDKQARANVQWTLRFDVDPKPERKGTTKQDGLIEEDIPRGASAAHLILDGTEIISINLGHLDPIKTVRGVQARLVQLGYNVGPVDGVVGPRTRSAIGDFQRDNSPLVVDGVCGPKTRAELLRTYGS